MFIQRELAAYGPRTFELYVDGTLAHTESLTDTRTPKPLRLPTSAQGYRWRMRHRYTGAGSAVKTVRASAAHKQYRPRQQSTRTSKLDPFKPGIVRWLEQHPFSTAQILTRLREAGYSGGRSILWKFVHQVRPRRQPAFLTLNFAPGACAQIDWGCAGSIPVGSTRRRLSFLVMVLCYSRKLYLEFTLSETIEQFLACQQNALQYFGAAPAALMIDNLKTAVLSHPRGQPAVLHPRYLDFARHYGLEIRACNVRAAHGKCRVERAIGYVKHNFLAGLELTSLAAVNAAAARWRDEVANRRLHGQTRQTPDALFAAERAQLRPLPPTLYDVSLVRTVSATRCFRVRFDGNSYRPPEYAGTRLSLHLTRAQDLLDLDLPAANLNLYQPSTPKETTPDETRR